MSKRAYKEAYNFNESLRMIKNGDSGVFDKSLIELLEDSKNDIIKLKQSSNIET